MKPSEAGTAALIAIDWGTTNRRGYLIGPGGAILDRRADGFGLANVQDADFQSAFDAMVAPWVRAHGALPALLSGMVGASTGWKEAPYCNLPADTAALASNLEQVCDDPPIWVVPGVAARGRNEMPDVMRGEEVQAIAAATGGQDLIVLPGTHSKWVRMVGSRIVGFKTFMTGDLHAAVLNHTVVSTLATTGAEAISATFDHGVDSGRTHHAELTHVLFGARSRVLFGELAAEDVPDYVSGLLIGAEIAAALETSPSESVLVVGSEHLSALYQRALTRCDVEARVANDARLGGTYWDLAVHAGLIEAGGRRSTVFAANYSGSLQRWKAT